MNQHYTQTKDVLCNPQNPENPDSKPSVAGKFILGPIGEKSRSISSLQKDVRCNPVNSDSTHLLSTKILNLYNIFHYACKFIYDKKYPNKQITLSIRAFLI
jgi:hypothetical protein